MVLTPAHIVVLWYRPSLASEGAMNKRKRTEKRLPTRATARGDPLRITEERLGLITDATTEGIYDWNVVTNALYLSDRLKSILGIVELTSYKWAEHVHPD